MDEIKPGFAMLDIPATQIEPGDLPPGATSLDFLQSVYRDGGQPLSVRMRAAIAALPFERPKLAVVAKVEGFATQMKLLARERYATGNVIDATPIPKTPAPAPKAEQ